MNFRRDEDIYRPIIANAYSVSPAPTTKYWMPSSSYVIGPLVIPVCSPACHSGVPVAGSSATRLFEVSPAKSSLPAVLNSPDRPPPLPGHLWLQRTLPV